MVVNILIIGAGPAGCILAKLLNKRFNVMLVDKNVYSRNKLCGGVLIDDSIEFLKNACLPESVYAKPKDLGLKYLDWDNGVSKKQDKLFMNIDRLAFDRWLINSVKELDNVEIVEGLVEKVIEKQGFEVQIKLKEESVKVCANVVVDASGAFSITHPRDYKMVYTAVQFEGGAAGKLSDFLYILSSELNDYYSWVIPKNGKVVIGACFNGRDVSEGIARMKKEFERNLGFVIEGWEMSAAPMLRPQTMHDIVLHRKNVLAIGESAGLIDPQTGEGISFALRSAEACAIAINSNSSIKDIINEYEINSKYLLNELDRKIRMSGIFMDPKQRKGIIDKIGK
jgi:geranylgeranyl diphosphate/geranylgeranyl-bacteriochlorophyllide a reductase